MDTGLSLITPDSQRILQPVLALMVLMLMVWIVLFVTRFKAAGALKLQANDLSTPEDVQQKLPRYAMNPAYNFKNLFEVPVLFSALCFYLYLMGQVDDTHVTCAWIFVLGRYIHSGIQCSYNNVNHRFLIYFVSSIAVWTMLTRTLLASL